MNAKAHNNDLNAAAVAFLDSPNQYPPYPVSTSQLLFLVLVRRQELIVKLLGGRSRMG